MNIKEKFGESLREMRNIYATVFTDSEIGGAIFENLCIKANMASEHDRKQIDNLPNLQGIADRLESNAHYGTVNFRLQYALAMTHEDIENLDSDEIVTLQNEHKFHNTENARCYYNLLLLEELIVRQGSDIPKTYLELDRKLISSH